MFLDMWQWIQDKVDGIYHQMFGCGEFWATHTSTNNKPFKRQCSICGRRQIRRNGEWCENGHAKLEYSNNRF